MRALLDRLRDLARRGHADPDAATGRRGEDLAHRFLQRQGYTVVARNYRPPSGAGEIDLVAWDGATLVFVEVKTRASEEFGTPDRAVDAEKVKRLLRAARAYAHRAGVEMERARFDIVSVVLEQPPRLELIRDAFRISQTI
jgi:putative endonuclease